MSKIPEKRKRQEESIGDDSGFAAADTSSVVENGLTIRVHGKDIPYRAGMVEFEGLFTAHGTKFQDQKEATWSQPTTANERAVANATTQGSGLDLQTIVERYERLGIDEGEAGKSRSEEEEDAANEGKGEGKGKSKAV